MPRVFGRAHFWHDYQDALNELLQEHGATGEAMALNLIHDHRVSPVREKSFDKRLRRNRKLLAVERGVSVPLDANLLKFAVEDYFDTKVRRRRVPHFIFPRINEDNILNDGGKRFGLKEGTMLVRVLNLNGIWRLFRWKARKFAAWKQDRIREGLLTPNSAGVDAWLNKKLEDENRHEAMVSLILDLLEENRASHAFQPTWATSWDEFRNREFHAGGAERWSQVLGVDHDRKVGQWLILLAYPVTRDLKIVRPTQLDARWYPRHYPTPKVNTPCPFGHPMDLNASGSPPADGLLPEYIHPQTEHPFEHFRAAGCLIGQTRTAIGGRLRKERRDHRLLLVQRYGASIQP